MAMKKCVWLLVLGFCLWSVQAWSQADCMEQFKKIQDKTRLMRAQSGKAGFEMDCRIIVTTADGGVYKDRMTMGTRGDKYKYTSRQYALYQDNKTMVVIQHDRRMVYLSHSSPKSIREAEFADMLKLQDSLLRYMTLAGCEKEFGSVKSNEGYQKLRFIPGEKIKGAGLKSVTYWIESATEEVRKMSIDYAQNGNYRIRNYVIIIDKMNSSSTTAPFSGDAIAMAMDRGRLKAEYGAYQLIDKRR